MAPASFSLAGICREIKEYISKHAFNNDDTISISIGAPAFVKDIKKNNKNQRLVNLFFYRFEPFGFDADVKNNETLFLKTYCLITAFGTKVKEIEAGEIELDLISKVIRLFHERPVGLFPAKTSPKVQVQFIFRPLKDEQINQIWSTQSNTTYQPSILYEMALVPVPPQKPAPQPTKVGHIGTLATSDITDRKTPYPKDRDYRTPTITSPITVNTGASDWAPVICLVDDNECVSSLSIEVTRLQDNKVKIEREVQLWLAGDKDDTKSTYYLTGAILKIPDKQSGAQQWIDIDPTQLELPKSLSIDPEDINKSYLQALQLAQLDYNAEINDNWQLQLYVERRYTSAENTKRTIRSNPVLITLWMMDKQHE